MFELSPGNGRWVFLLLLLMVLTSASPEWVLPQVPLPDGILESNHVWSGSFDSAMFGYRVADAGDVNGDGFSDIVVGAYGWDVPGGLFDEGAAFVFLGGPDGIVGTDPSTANAVLLGDQAGTEFGWSVAGAGDVNGDGFDDIIVGAHHYDSTIAGGTLAVDGAAFVFLGSPTGIDATGPSTAHASIFGTVLDSRLGHAVSAAGDVNNDGYGDIIVGMPRMGIPFACTQTNPPTCNIPENDYQGSGGAALIFLGSAEGITGTSIDDADSVILSHPPGQPAVSGDQVGADVAAAGDVNNDGFSDVLVGAGGYIMVFHGSAAGIVGTDPTSADTKITSSATISVGARVSSAGDVNGDGFSDILVADPSYPTIPFVSSGPGAVLVFHGGPSGITAATPASSDGFIEGTAFDVLQNFGWQFSAAGDVDGDGFGDIIVGGLEFAGSLDLEGSAYLFLGSAAGITGSSEDAYQHGVEVFQETEAGCLLNPPLVPIGVNDKPLNQGKPISAVERSEILKAFADGKKFGARKKEVMEEVMGNYQRGYWSIEKILKEAGGWTNLNASTDQVPSQLVLAWSVLGGASNAEGPPER